MTQLTALRRAASLRRPVRPHAPMRSTQRRCMHALSSDEIRVRFLQFFERNGHTVVPSASIIPPGSDTSLLFTNAGMVPFKRLFLGHEQRAYVRATSSQRCVRAGGKHNDLDQVGLTRRHHTQFEMLGNFSFGDYFKEEAIVYGWKFLTEELALPKERLHVTVLHSDDEARALWKKVAGLTDRDIRACGEDDNFWAMGDSGPCGPCSEIFWDLGDHIADPDERFLELWNLVFMQFSRNEGDATLHALPKKSVDTGMGLERVASVLQQVPSNYHTDQFVPILHQVASVLDASRSRSRAGERSFASVLKEELDPLRPQFGSSPQIQTLRIIADHLRASYAMLSDGIFPSNVGRGYVLRRIIRRAIRFAQNVGGVNEPFLTKIVVPEWERANGFAQMRGIIANEEKAFQEMLLNGNRALEKVFSQAAATRMVSGVEAFRLYDTYGIPLDITQVLAEEKGFTVDSAAFEAAMEAHRRLATESSVFSTSHGDGAQPSTGGAASAVTDVNSFTGYVSLRVENARVVSVWNGSEKPEKKGKTPASATFWVALDPCPFYAESGGQVGDRGELRVRLSGNLAETIRIPVKDTKRLPSDVIALQCSLPEGWSFSDVQTLLVDSDSAVDAQVDERFRSGCQVHHSATHLLQRALKQVLGDHVTQAGSFVTTDRLRFDFAHFGAMTLDELARVEALVNELALQQIPVDTAVLPRAEAETSGAICNFGEKYGDVVRVVSMGDVSSEFCGGTHVTNTASIFPFVILSEGSVAAGTRRMEALAGVEGAKHLQTKDRTLQQLAAQLETTPAKVPERITKMQKQIKQLESAAQALGDTLASLPPSPVLETEAVAVHTLQSPGSGVGSNASAFSKVLRRRAEFLLKKHPQKAHVVVLGSQVVCISNGEKVHAGQWLQQLVKPLGGRGGGNATFSHGTVPDTVSVEALCAHLQAN